jgi:hypothetical protein
MSDDDTPSNRRTDVGRRHLLAAAAGAATLPVSRTVATTPVSQRTADELTENGRPEDVARAYIEALDAGNRAMANAFLVPRGELDRWSRREFVWVDSFEIEYVGFETVARRDGDVIADIELTIAGNDGTVRYRFRETADGWTIWEAVEGLRSAQEPDTNADAVAEAYVAALNAGNRGAVNELIADDGTLAKWSSRQFDWVGAFEFEFISFHTVRTDDDGVVGDIRLEVGGNRRTVRYRFRETAAGSVELWAPVSGIRTTGELSAEAAADAYVAALDDGSRAKTNSLIADAGQLDPWSEQDFRWVRAFSFELVDFEATRRQDDRVVAELTVLIGETTEPVTYEFRRVGDGWKIWQSFGGIR